MFNGIWNKEVKMWEKVLDALVMIQDFLIRVIDYLKFWKGA